jgi:beta-glucosidase
MLLEEISVLMSDHLSESYLTLEALNEAWHPGQAGGTAIAEVIFVTFNPGGKLPVTFSRNFENLAPIDEYDIT